MNEHLRPWLKAALIASSVVLMTGCVPTLFDSSGVTGREIGNTILLTMGLMLIVVIPTIGLSIWAPWKYSKNKNNPDYAPEWDHSTKIELYAWGVPVAITLVLAVIAFRTSFSLDPRAPIESDKPVQTIQVVALDWKWLFIYPDEQVATVNELAIPVDTPVEFLVTSTSTMNSFFIPKIAGQIYAMAGMENRLNAMADETGSYRGISANYSGYGFSGMRFETKVLEENEYQQWLEQVRSAPQALTEAEYEQLLEQTRDHPVEYFNSVNPLLFKNIIESFTGVQDGSQ